MTGLVRKATILCVGGLLLAGSAMAGIPSATNSLIPTCITLADARSTSACVALIIRDANNNPVAGASVTFDFSACPGIDTDVKLCDTQQDQAVVNTSPGSPGTQPAFTVCGSKTITVSADALGQLCVILGGGTNLVNGHTPAAARPVCCTIYADNRPMGTVLVTVASFDHNGTASVNAGDLSIWLSQYSPAVYRSKGDYNCDGLVNAGDLSKLLGAIGLGLPPAEVGCASFCL